MIPDPHAPARARVREQLARIEHMQTQTSVVDTTSEPVAEMPLAAVLIALRRYIRRYVVVTADQATATTLWAAHTHAIEAADCTAYLHVTSATPRAGKTRLLEILEPIVARPWLTGRTSTAALYRRIDQGQPTLLLDESDAALGRDADREYAEALRGVLCAGYRRSGRVTLCVGQGASFQVREFAAFAPKAIAGIGDLPATIQDRSIRITLRRRTQDEPCARWRERDGQAEAAPLHRALVSWAAEPIAIQVLRDARPELPVALGDREADVWEPLLAIADAAGGDWPKHARQAAVNLAGAAAAGQTDILVELLRDIAEILGGNGRGRSRQSFSSSGSPAQKIGRGTSGAVIVRSRPVDSPACSLPSASIPTGTRRRLVASAATAVMPSPM